MATTLTSYNVAPNPNDASGASALPIGAVTMWATSTAPSGWLLCNGQAVSRTLFAALFSVIGTTWGAGDGSTTFNVPNTAGRVIRGVNGTYTQASTGGADTVTLAANQLAFHGHNLNDPGHSHTYSYYGSFGSTGLANGGSDPAKGRFDTGTSTVTTGITVQPSLRDGSDNPVITQQPVSLVNTYLAMNYIIKAA